MRLKHPFCYCSNVVASQILSHENCALDGVDYCPLRSSLLDLLKVHSERNKDAFCASYVFTGIKDAGGHVGKAFAAPKIVGEFTYFHNIEYCT